MIETPTHKTVNMCPQLYHAIQFRLSKVNDVKEYFIADIHEGEIMSKTLNKYVAAFNYIGKTLFLFISNKSW